ncbi:hypothetical protein [Listeria ivanovii]|uniref:hypothetical protein n=2 Tax=Listeria ivanovii TaxID=1638 RepID=UPI0019441A0B|nr:hypothetical protein [Listeria ivanovii]
MASSFLFIQFEIYKKGSVCFMFELINIDERMMDRDIEMRNTVTNTLEVCFDNSIGYSDNNFSFMKTGFKYECKILLVGDQLKEATKDTVKFLLAKDWLVCIKNNQFIRVLLDKDEYYIHYDGLIINNDDEYILFDYFRKDLLEVNGQVSPIYSN